MYFILFKLIGNIQYFLNNKIDKKNQIIEINIKVYIINSILLIYIEFNIYNRLAKYGNLIWVWLGVYSKKSGVRV